MVISVADMRRTPEGYFTVRWGQPEYTDWIDESMSWKETCYIGDWFLWERRSAAPTFSGFSPMCQLIASRTS
jgi:vanillate/3-O-methylgallate O-demethylase